MEMNWKILKCKRCRLTTQAQSPGVTKAPVDPGEIPVWGTVVMVFQGEQHKSLRMVHFVSEAAQIQC